MSNNIPPHFRGRILIGLDVESGNTDSMHSIMSVGITAIDQQSLAVLLKTTIFLPFNISQISNECFKGFWEKNPKIFNLHISNSEKLGYDPKRDSAPTFFERGTEDWLAMQSRISHLETLISGLEKQLESSGDDRIIEFYADNTLDFDSINFLLFEFLKAPPLSKRRLSNGTYQAYPLLHCQNSRSMLSFFDPEYLLGISNCVSTARVLRHFGISLPKNVPLHDHDPSNDSHRMVIQLACIYNYFMNQPISNTSTSTTTVSVTIAITPSIL